MKENVLIVFDSMSGNTKEVAELIKEELISYGDTVTMLHLQLKVSNITDLSIYDRVILGTWSDNNGAIPDAMLDFIEDHENELKNWCRLSLNVFGTGETQWGEENFCLSVRNLAQDLYVKTKVLEIEQYPAHKKQKDAISNWVSYFVMKTTKDGEDYYYPKEK